MGNPVTKRVRKGIAKLNQGKALAAGRLAKAAQPAKVEVKGKK